MFKILTVLHKFYVFVPYYCSKKQIEDDQLKKSDRKARNFTTKNLPGERREKRNRARGYLTRGILARCLSVLDLVSSFVILFSINLPLHSILVE